MCIRDRTHGIPVAGFGTDEFPAFYTRKSGLPVLYRVDTVTELAEMLYAKWQLGLEGGVLIANPIPDQAQVEFEYINEIIEKAVLMAEQKGIKGKAITPFLLAKIEELTGGESLKANIQLVFNNVKLGAELAVAFSKINNS